MYDKIFVPILKLASADNPQLAKPPPLLSTIHACHPLPTPKDQPEVIHVKIASKLLKEYIFSYKSTFFKNKPDFRVSIHEDLAPAIRKLFLDTKARSDVQKVWSVNGRVRFLLKDNPKPQTAKL